MFTKYSERREFLKYISLFFLFILNSCSNIAKKEKIVFQKSLYPESFKETIPNLWQKENINFERFLTERKRNIVFNSDFALINDGWINKIDFDELGQINNRLLLEKLDRRSQDFLSTFDQSQRIKLFPIGVVPYAVIIKNNKDLISSARQSWDFLLSSKFTRKIILPQSPRIIMSIAQKLNTSNPLRKLKSQALVFDDKNSLNWLINSDASIAIVPYSLCLKFLKIDPRLSVVFPNLGVPLIWYFLLRRSSSNLVNLIEWIESLESKQNSDKLVRQGWFLPFTNEYSQSKYKIDKSNIDIPIPSKSCWDESWSLPSLTEAQKIKLENSWNQSLIP